MCAIAGSSSEVCFEICGGGEEERIGVFGEEETEVEGVRRGLVDRNGEFGGLLGGGFGHFDWGIVGIIDLFFFGIGISEVRI